MCVRKRLSNTLAKIRC